MLFRKQKGAVKKQILICRDVCNSQALAPSDEGAVEQSETEGEKRLRFYAVSFLSLRLFAYAKSHLPRQREARAVIKFHPYKPQFVS